MWDGECDRKKLVGLDQPGSIEKTSMRGLPGGHWTIEKREEKRLDEKESARDIMYKSKVGQCILVYVSSLARNWFMNSGETVLDRYLRITREGFYSLHKLISKED